jgi:hypothetical protein
LDIARVIRIREGAPTIRNNVILGGSNTDVKGIVCEQDAGPAIIEGNTIFGGTAPSNIGIESNCTGIIIRNNTIHGGVGDATQGLVIRYEVGARTVVTNNTIFSGVGAVSSSGIYIRRNTSNVTYPVITNNILWGPTTSVSGTEGHCIYEDDSSSKPSSLQNNLFISAPIALYRDSSGNLDDAASINAMNDSLLGGGNMRVDNNITTLLTPELLFVDVDGPDDDLSTMDDNDWRLQTDDTAITEGGKDTSVDTCGSAGTYDCGDATIDRDGVNRTLPVSIGAYERD